MNTQQTRLTPEQRRERARKRSHIHKLLDEVGALTTAVGRVQFEHGAFSKDIRWELERLLGDAETILRSEAR